jgi:hypothetical protein
MPNKSIGISVFILAVFLFSSIGFAIIQLDLNDYYDFDTATESTVLNSSHDVRCTGTGILTPVNNARKLNNATSDNNAPIVTNYTNVMAGVWSQGQAKLKETAPAGDNRYAYFVTTDWNYTKVYSKTVTTDKCEFETPQLSVKPYFDGTDYPATYENTLASWTNDAVVYLSFYDLGLMANNWIGSNARYWVATNELIYYNATTKYATTYSDSDLEHLYSSECLLSSGYGDFNFSEINQPDGTYDIYCWNSTITDRPYIGVFMLLTHSGSDGSFRAVWLNTEYFDIFGVAHSPNIPLANMSVVVSWATTLTADSRVYYRYATISNVTSYSGWTSIYDATATTSHAITISGSYILDNYYYQYWVQSIRSGTEINETNNGNYYNFTVGGGKLPEYIVPPSLENQTYPVLYNATYNLANNLGVDQFLIVNLFAIIIVLITTIGSLWFTHSPLMAGGVFIIGVALLSLFGYLPYYMFIIIALIIAMAMVRVIGGIFG